MSDVDSETESQGQGVSALDEFRESWQRELQVQAEHTQADTGSTVHASEADLLQAKAESLYRTAVQLEQRGKVYDAIPFYRKATQIVPDIEFKFYEQQKLNNEVNKKYHNLANDFSKQLDLGQQQAEGTEGDHKLIDNLYEKFQHDLRQDSAYKGKLMASSRDPGVLSTGLHISDLPPEIVMRILRWVVSSQLDMRSLEQCSAVCKGFYVYARDEELWRLACVKVWGHSIGTLDAQDAENSTVYYSWRDMFIRRERVNFSGCYISKTTYLRMGENSFQDQFYRPVQLVEYYRYIRFMPDGKVLMMTSADEPAQGVTKIRNVHNIRPDVLRGRYRLFGDTVTLVLQKSSQSRPTTGHLRQRRGSVMPLDEDSNATQFLIELRISHSPKRRCAQLVWSHYALVQKRNKVDTSSEFDLTEAKYPSLWFSPVKSYHLDADAPLV
ncbi:F-box only protein 9 [Drosophila guanche]|uniref:Blast:F-box only protein 9 n=1 Tax=Drosophila guanche TaxID=7266 RepID=A0A3B0KCN4_DROGU|nr:F-box only protein 9 [Drosophila guanche]SPP81398.1 blast:F-box only protein 9 [Drosophila guanche]